MTVPNGDWFPHCLISHSPAHASARRQSGSVSHHASSTHRQLRSGFLNFDTVPPDVLSNQVIALVAAGFPSSDQIYDLSENNNLGTVKRNLIAVLDGQPNDIALIRARFVEPLDFDPDGMSGSPVFVIQFENGEPSAYLAGMITRAGKETFHFLKIGYIKAFLDAFLARNDSGTIVGNGP